MSEPQRDYETEHATYEDHSAEQHSIFFGLPPKETEAEQTARRERSAWVSKRTAYGSADY